VDSTWRLLFSRLSTVVHCGAASNISSVNCLKSSEDCNCSSHSEDLASMAFSPSALLGLWYLWLAVAVGSPPSTMSLSISKGLMAFNCPHSCPRPWSSVSATENLCDWIWIVNTYLSHRLLAVTCPYCLYRPWVAWWPYFYLFCFVVYTWFNVEQYETSNLVLCGSQILSQFVSRCTFVTHYFGQKLRGLKNVTNFQLMFFDRSHITDDSAS